MERIGITASKIAKGNLFLYNLFVILISFLFSLLIFLLAGISIFIALWAIDFIHYILNGDHVYSNFGKEWTSVMLVCMISLTIVVSVFNLLAILKNIKFTKSR